MRTTRGTNPEREAVKEYLQQYHDAKAKKQILEERHRTLSADLRDPGVGSTYTTKPTSKRQAREGGAVSLVYRIAEVEDRIAKQRDAMAVFDYYNAALDTLLTYKRTEKLLGDYTAAKEKSKRG